MLNILLFKLAGSLSYAQTPSNPNPSIIEEFTEITGNELFDFTDLELEWEALINKPIFINKAQREELERLFFLNEQEIDAILQYRKNNGNFISVYELQSIPALDLEKCKLLAPFIAIEDSWEDAQSKLVDQLKTSQHEILVHGSTTLQKRRGFLYEDGQDPAYLGDPFRYLLRYRGHYENKLSYGLSAEKDMGEPWQKNGFDFYTAHLFIRDLTKKIKTLALGDYNLSLGQGLLLHTGFGRGKSAFSTQIKRGGYTLRPSTGINEFLYFRGIAATFTLSKRMESTLFLSARKLDARILTLETALEDKEAALFFSSFQTSGLHRTKQELQDKNSVLNQSLGGKIKIAHNNNYLCFNALADRFNYPIVPADNLQNANRLNGNFLLNLSLDYTYVFKNFHFFGEIAHSFGGGFSALNGLMLGLHPKARLSMLYRSFSPKYQNLHGNPFSEGLQPSNEKGFYMGLEINPLKKWTLNTYFDGWKHPWLRFNADAISTGKEILWRITFKERRTAETYLHFRQEWKERNDSSAPLPSSPLAYYTRQQLRWHLEYKVGEGVLLRNRIEITAATSSPDQPLSRGVMILQDLIYKPLESKLHFTARVALFQTDSYASRIYAYENDVRYSFSIPPYFGKGLRSYLTLRYNITKNLKLEFRISNTTYFQQEQIGSGQDTIEGNKRTDLKLQLLYRIKQ
jgi:hypothetical protein